MYWCDRMKKLSNKGFMMAEVIVVSAVIMTTLVALYTSYNKIFSIYNQRVRYYDVTTLYELAFIRDNEMYKANDGTIKLDSNGFVKVEDKYIKDLENISNINDKKYNRNILYVGKDGITGINTDKINKTYKEYIEYLSGSIDVNKIYKIDNIENTLLADDGNIEDYKYTINWNNILIMERCKIDDNNACTYAYIEIPVVERIPK